MAQIFPPTTPAGHGTVHLTLYPPQFATLTYAYPLKLISPSPHLFTDSTSTKRTIQTLFLLSYGGGIVAGDKIILNIKLDPLTRLNLLTQGSTKLFRTPDPKVLSSQYTTVDIGSKAALCYIPDPVQPFADSAFEQRQLYRLRAADASLCVCDWVCCGRAATGERWNFWRYGSRNEVYDARDKAKPRLLLRDNMILEPGSDAGATIAAKVEDHGVFGTLIICGPLFESVGKFFLDEFEALPRIGAKNWDDTKAEAPTKDTLKGRRLHREKICNQDGLLWTAAHVRGFVMVKFAAREVEGARRWLRDVLLDEGSIERNLGERALLCLK
jgi:urease accessory protein